MTAEREEAERLLRLAERDHRAFELLVLKGSHEDFAVAAFHAQQSVEKSLKAVLCIYRVEFRRTHDLLELAGRIRDRGLELPVPDEMLQRLTPYAVEFRYDDQALPLIGPDEAKVVTENCLRWVANLLELKR